MSEIIFTQTFQRKAAGYGLKDARYLCYAAMRAAGIGINDAWNLTFLNAGQTWDKSRLKAEQQKLENLDGVQQFVAELKKERESKSQTDEISADDLAKATSKEAILSDLLKARKLVKQNSKEWLDMTAKIADYARIKQDEIKEEDTTIHYYLPVNYPKTCKDCLLWQNGKAIGQKKK
jgi:hypothetical protein